MPNLILPPHLQPRQRKQELNLTIHDKNVMIQLAHPAKEISLDPQSAIMLGKAMVQAAQECYNKYQRANDYSVGDKATEELKKQ